MEGLTTVDASLVTYIHPSKGIAIKEAFSANLSTLLFKFNETFDGVVLAYSPVVIRKVRKILSAVHSYIGVSFKAKLLVFNPLPDMFVEGEVILVSQRSIHVIVLGFAACTIAEEDICGEFKHKNKDGENLFVSRSHKKHRIRVGTFLRFSVKSFDEETLHICGSLIPVQTGCVRWLERHSEEWSQLESTSKKRTASGEIEDVATPRKETEESSMHESAVVDNGGAIISGSPNKKHKRRKMAAKGE